MGSGVTFPSEKHCRMNKHISVFPFLHVKPVVFQGGLMAVMLAIWITYISYSFKKRFISFECHSNHCDLNVDILKIKR
jgi:hypothetical protein